jgi:hypothetical protein
MPDASDDIEVYMDTDAQEDMDTQEDGNQES